MQIHFTCSELQLQRVISFTVQTEVLWTCTAVYTQFTQFTHHKFQVTCAALHCLAINFAQYKKFISAAMHYRDI